MTTVSIRYGLGFEDFESPHGPWYLSDHAKIEVTEALAGKPANYLRTKEPFLARVRLKLQSAFVPVYTTTSDAGGTALIARTAPRSIGGCIEWEAIEAFYLDPAGSTVEFRLHDGTDSLHWDGGTWSVAGSTDWNTEIELRDNIGAYPLTKSIAVEFRLQTTDAAATPVVFGVKLMVRIRLPRGITHELVNETLIKSLEDNLALTSVAHFPVLTATQSVFSFTAQDLEYNKTVTGIVSVHNLTADPDMLTALSGTWDNNAKTWTADTSLSSGADIFAIYSYLPQIVFSANRELLLQSGVALIVENFETIEVRDTNTKPIVRNTSLAIPTAKSIRSPQSIDYRCRLRIIAENPVSAQNLEDSIFGDWLGAGLSRIVVTPNTAQTILIKALRGTAYAASSSSRLFEKSIDINISGFRKYFGIASTINLLKADGALASTARWDEN